MRSDWCSPSRSPTITVISVLETHLARRPDLISRKRRRAGLAIGFANLAIKIGKPDDAVSTLSGGNQQRVVLAKWLATEPKLLILDSPTVGVDVGARAGIFAIVRELAAEGMAILLISDEIPEVYFNADRILHMAPAGSWPNTIPSDDAGRARRGGLCVARDRRIRPKAGSSPSCSSSARCVHRCRRTS